MVDITGPASWWQFWKGGVLAADEAWVVNELGKVQQGAQVVLSDVNAVLQWTFAHFDDVAAETQKIIAVANVLGVGANPYVLAAEAAATAILQAVAAAKAASANAAPTDLAQISASAQAAYVAVKQLQVANATAAVTVATGSPPKAT